MKLNLYYLIIIIVFISCSKKLEKNQISSLQNISIDTIKMPKNIRIGTSCLNQIKGYKKRYGIVFSNYYREESLSIDFDNNKTIDTIVILKPFYENSIDNCYPKNAEYDFPILLISKTINKNKFFKIYKNILTSNGPNSYEEIIINNSGFIISKEINGNNGFFSKIYISYQEPNFYVDSINVESWGEYQYKKLIKFKNKTFELSRYKRTDIDSIRNISNKN